MKKTHIIGIVLLLAIFGIVGYSMINKPTTAPNINSNRPSYCDENGCVPEKVFMNLPDMPDDFLSKWALVYYNRISDLDIIEEEYWKQPEFYANSFKEQCMQYYTTLEKQDKVMFFSSGSGAYPGDIGAYNVDPGEDLKFVTFWHTGCAIARFQLFSLGVEYPENMNFRMRNISVNQRPEVAKNCFDIKIEPDYLFLHPSYPMFGYNHTQKVKLKVHVNEGCPSGEYGLSVLPIDPPQDKLEKLEWEYGFKLSSSRAGGVWNIYIGVE